MSKIPVAERAASAIKAKLYKIDMAGTLYPSVATSKWSGGFRMTVRLSEPVRPEQLQAALDRTLPRFPSMAVRLKAGFLWYYLEANDRRMLIAEKDGRFCRPFRKFENNGFLMRVLYGSDSISAEFFHAITDGSGGMTFLKTLTAEYLRQCGIDVPAVSGVLDIGEAPSPMETTDDYQKLPNVKTFTKYKLLSAYHFPGLPRPNRAVHGTSYQFSAAALKKAAAAVNTTVTVYLASILLYIGYCAQEDETPGRRRRLTISIPVNLRGRFGGITLRNFSWFAHLSLDRMRNYSFEDILQETAVNLKNASTQEMLTADIAANRNMVGNPVFKILPLPVKNLLASVIYHFIGDRPITVSISNLGIIEMPPEMRAHVKSFDFGQGVPYGNTTNCAVATTNDNVTIRFTSRQQNPVLPGRVRAFLEEHGVPVTTYSDRGYF